MRIRVSRRNRVVPIFLIVALMAALAPATALARKPLWFSPPVVQQNQVIYDSTVTPLPQHLPSLGFEATQTSEFGDEITFDGSSRALQQVTVTMVSWACESGAWQDNDCVTTPGSTFSVPITFTIYNVDDNDTAGSIIASRTQTFDIPYQPSDDAQCENAGWYDTDTESCVNGIDANITFDFSSMAVTLPGSVIYGISFNTSTYGSNPIGTGGAYDALNVGLSSEVVVGSKPHPDTVFWNTSTANNYCETPALGAGVFQLDSPGNACWTDYVPAVQFTAGTPPATGQMAWLYNFVRQFYSIWNLHR